MISSRQFCNENFRRTSPAVTKAKWPQHLRGKFRISVFVAFRCFWCFFRVFFVFSSHYVFENPWKHGKFTTIHSNDKAHWYIGTLHLDCTLGFVLCISKYQKNKSQNLTSFFPKQLRSVPLKLVLFWELARRLRKAFNKLFHLDTGWQSPLVPRVPELTTPSCNRPTTHRGRYW